MKIISKFMQMRPTQSRPLKSTIFPDHPHPTMLIEGGQESGDGIGWKKWKVKKKNRIGVREEKYKAKQRELDQVGSVSQRLSIGELLPFDFSFYGRSFVLGLPDRILIGPNDEGERTVHPRPRWARHKWRPAVLCAALTRGFYRSDSDSTRTKTLIFTTKEVPL